MSRWRQSHYISTLPMFMEESQCTNRLYDPAGIINRLTTKSYESTYHHGSLRYLQILYYDAKLQLRLCVSQALFTTASATINQEITPSPPPTAPPVSRNVFYLINTSNDNKISTPASINISIIQSIKTPFLRYPITFDIFQDPVMEIDGFNYERSTI